MEQYIQVEFQNVSQEQSDILIAQLSEVGFEGFEEGSHFLKAFIRSDKYQEDLFHAISQQHGLPFSKSIIEETNWNQVWESNFSPVVVDDFVAIRADFHAAIKDVKFEIVITPKMSFGTGHHATTFLMMQQMERLDFSGKSILDFGTGTGVLAILAEKLGAKKVVAIDNDKWSIENATENFQRNDCRIIELRLEETAFSDEKFDIILANINKNVILDNLAIMANQLNEGGSVILSGLLIEDEPDVLNKAHSSGLQLVEKADRHNWLLLKLSP